VRRRLFNFAAAVSLVMLLATGMLWVRSHWVADDIRRDHYSIVGGFARVTMLEGYSDRGQFSVARESDSNPNTKDGASGVTWNWLVDADPPTPNRFGRSVRGGSVFATFSGQAVHWTWHGFELSIWPLRHSGTGSPGYSTERTQVAVPFWALAAIMSFLPLVWVIRDRRQKPGHCANCGYNLTGNVSGTCPECGTPVAGKVGVTG